MNTQLASSDRILATPEAHECYNLLCGQRPVEADTLTKRKEVFGDPKKTIFSDTIQAFFVAAVVGHLLQDGARPTIEDKAKAGLLLLQQWEREERRDIRKALTFLAKMEYDAKDPKEILQVIAELSEVGIRHIRDKVVESGDFDLSQLINRLRKETDKKGVLLE